MSNHFGSYESPMPCGLPAGALGSVPEHAGVVNDTGLSVTELPTGSAVPCGLGSVPEHAGVVSENTASRQALSVEDAAALARARAEKEITRRRDLARSLAQWGIVKGHVIDNGHVVTSEEMVASEGTGIGRNDGYYGGFIRVPGGAWPSGIAGL